MSLRQTIKTKICLTGMSPNYPLGEFVVWAERLDHYALLQYLDDIQHEIEEERQVMKYGSEEQILRSYWCFYCEQIRKYYQAIVRNPGCKSTLSFLLIDALPDKSQR